MSKWFGKILRHVSSKSICIILDLIWEWVWWHDKWTLAHCRLVTGWNGEVMDFSMSCRGEGTWKSLMS